MSPPHYLEEVYAYARFDRTGAVRQWISGGVPSAVAMLLKRRNAPPPAGYTTVMMKIMKLTLR